jgi:class 3 adenylate cyclase/tetratricopeptide (TPR) repeat protein
MRCGTSLVQRCANCGAENPLGAHFCLRCGTPLRATVLPERRVVTALFADLVGSTPLTARLDPEPARALIGEFFAQMREEVERHSGVVEKFIGDAVMAVFGLPAAHDDDPERAVRAALAMRERLVMLNTRRGTNLHVRIGVSTGEVVTDPDAVRAGQAMVTGEAINLAARLQQQAAPDAIVIDERTYAATRHAVEARLLPAPPAGDFAGRPRWEIAGLADRRAAKGLHAPMLGREGEMQFLLALYRRVVDSRRPHLVTVIGAAGVGKSRLAREFIEALAVDGAAAQVLRGRCPAYGEGLTFWPLAEMLKQECGIKDNDPAPVVLAKLQEGVRRVCASVMAPGECEEIVAGLAPVLGLEAPGHEVWGERLQTLRRTVESRAAVMENPGILGGTPSADDGLSRVLRRFMAAKAAAGPVVLLFEDVHWAEQSLLDLLEHLVARTGEAPILTLCLARPEMLERHPHWGRRVRNYTAVSLVPLAGPLGKKLITGLLGGEPVPPDVRDAILARAEGNPFFIEEILRMLIDGGGLIRDAGGWGWASYPVEISIPDTIHGILASRLDLLSALEKRVVGEAALIGRTFWLGALIATSGLQAAEVAAALDRLQEREVVEERPASSLVGDREFIFRHALMREVAYATLPKAQRSTHHLRFAEWLEQGAGGNDEFLEILAHHVEQAWRFRFETGERDEGLARRAIDALVRAGARATKLRTLPEARRLYDRALAVLHNAGLADDVPLLLRLLTSRCEVAKWMQVPDVVREDTDTILRLAPTIGRGDLVARAWLNRAFAEIAGYDADRIGPAEDALRRAFDLFREQGDRRGEAEAIEVTGLIAEDLRGKLAKAHAAYRQALDLYRELGDGQGQARVLARLGRSLLDAGRLEEGRPVLAEALRLAAEHHEPLSNAYALTGLGIYAHLTGDDAEAVRALTEAIRIRRDLGNLLAEAYTRQRLGMQHLRAGRLDDAEREFHAARALRREQGAQNESAVILRGLAEVYLARNDLLAAAEHAERALALLPAEEAIGVATHRATLGKIRAAQGRREDAEELFRLSLETLERREYPIDLALALVRYGEALLMLSDRDRARQALERARDLFATMGAARFVRICQDRLAETGAAAAP